MSDEKQIAVASESKAIATGSVFSDMANFDNAQRMAKALSSSSLVPTDYRGNVANTLIAMEVSQRTNTSPMAVMQNMHIIHGKPSWSSQFVIAAVNGCGRFTPMRFKVEGEGDNKTCTAYASDKQTGDLLEGIPVSIEMAKAEGWFSKTGSKWKTMPDLMLRYRAAKFFGNMYAPDILMGMHMADEVQDIRASESATISTVNSSLATPPPSQVVDNDDYAEYIEAEVVETTPQSTSRDDI